MSLHIRKHLILCHFGYIILNYHGIIIRTFHYLIVIWSDCVIFTIVYNWFANKIFLLKLTTKVPVCSNICPLTLPYCIYSGQGGYIIVITTVYFKILLLNSPYIWSFSTSRLIINYNTGTSGTTAFIVYICGLHVSTYTQVIFRPSCTRESIKSYARWDPIALTSLKHINYIKCLCLSNINILCN